MKIFLTYASEDKHTAEQVYLALVGSNHTVFFDRASLPPGVDYNARIRQAILDSGLLVFLISDNSVTESSYALTELAFAQKKWPHPAEVVIPVMVRRTGYERIPQALSRHWQAPVVLGIAALVLAIAFLGEGRIGDGDGSRDQVARELEEMKAKLRSMGAESAMIKADYQALKVSFSQLQQGQKEELGAELESELALRLGDLSDEPSVVVPSYWAEIEAVTQDPLLSSAEKGDRMVDLITAALHDLDAEIEGQAQRLDSGPPSASIDVETTKLKRLIDRRSQMYDMLRQIIDEYHQTAKGIIDSMGR